MTNNQSPLSSPKKKPATAMIVVAAALVFLLALGAGAMFMKKAPEGPVSEATVDESTMSPPTVEETAEQAVEQPPQETIAPLEETTPTVAAPVDVEKAMSPRKLGSDDAP